MTIKVVIGANFGDEGKGLMTDYFVNQFGGNCINVRFNGGAQAGHTVVTPDGKRHVFSHFGAGTFAGAATYLSEFFILNPLLFIKELQEDHFDSLPNVFVDDRCLVTTPYDMFINQALEHGKGEGRHGSCGVGINETVKRNSLGEFTLTAEDLRCGSWHEKLERVALEYFPKRLTKLGLAPVTFDHSLVHEYFEKFKRRIIFTSIDILKDRDLVFEGAQGLLLDQNHPYFPHVTRSNTGLKNAKVLIEKIGCVNEDIEVVYVTRSYLTRHGRGPFPTETKILPYEGIQEETNVFNEFQEHLRYGILDLTSLQREVEKDFKMNEVGRMSLAITHLDQVTNGRVQHLEDETGEGEPIETFLFDLGNRMLPYRLYTSYGKTREYVFK